MDDVNTPAAVDLQRTLEDERVTAELEAIFAVGQTLTLLENAHARRRVLNYVVEQFDGAECTELQSTAAVNEDPENLSDLFDAAPAAKPRRGGGPTISPAVEPLLEDPLPTEYLGDLFDHALAGDPLDDVFEDREDPALLDDRSEEASSVQPIVAGGEPLEANAAELLAPDPELVESSLQLAVSTVPPTESAVQPAEPGVQPMEPDAQPLETPSTPTGELPLDALLADFVEDFRRLADACQTT